MWLGCYVRDCGEGKEINSLGMQQRKRVGGGRSLKRAEKDDRATVERHFLERAGSGDSYFARRV
jgi:hypothetical protein